MYEHCSMMRIAGWNDNEVEWTKWHIFFFLLCSWTPRPMVYVFLVWPGCTVPPWAGHCPAVPHVCSPNRVIVWHADPTRRHTHTHTQTHTYTGTQLGPHPPLSLIEVKWVQQAVMNNWVFWLCTEIAISPYKCENTTHYWVPVGTHTHTHTHGHTQTHINTHTFHFVINLHKISTGLKV